MATITSAVRRSGVLKATPKEGQKVLILCPGYWGKGDDAVEAVKAMPYSFDEKRWVAYSVHPDVTIDGGGCWTRPAGTPEPEELLRPASRA